MTNAPDPFRFEDLNGKPEPKSWGPVYNINRKRGQSVRDAVREAQAKTWKRDPVFHSNSASGQAFEFSAAKHRAHMKAAFADAANADKRSWAFGTQTIQWPGFSGNIVEAYKQAMIEKAARLAIEAAVKPRKPHYILRNGEFKLAA